MILQESGWVAMKSYSSRIYLWTQDSQGNRGYMYNAYLLLPVAMATLEARWRCREASQAAARVCTLCIRVCETMSVCGCVGVCVCVCVCVQVHVSIHHY